MLTTKLIADNIQDAYHIQYVPVKFTGHEDYMVGQWDESQPDRLTFGPGESGLYYLIGNVEWQEYSEKTFYRTALYHYDKDGNQKTWLDSIYYDDRLNTYDRWVGPSGNGKLTVPIKKPLSRLLPPTTSGYIAFGEVEVEEGDYITMVGEHAGFDNRHMQGDIFLQVTKWE